MAFQDFRRGAQLATARHSLELNSSRGGENIAHFINGQCKHWALVEWHVTRLLLELDYPFVHRHSSLGSRKTTSWIDALSALFAPPSLHRKLQSSDGEHHTPRWCDNLLTSKVVKWSEILSCRMKVELEFNIKGSSPCLESCNFFFTK